MRRFIEAVLITTACLLILMCIISVLASDIISLGTWQHRGLLGDFVGGVIGTIVSALGVLLTVYIAFRVNELQKSLSNQAIQNQKIVAEIQMRNEAFRSYGAVISRAFILIGAEGIGGSSRKQMLMDEIPKVIAAHTLIVSTNLATLLVEGSSLIKTGDEFNTAYENVIAGESNEFKLSIENASKSLGSAMVSLSDWVVKGVYVEHSVKNYEWAPIKKS